MKIFRNFHLLLALVCTMSTASLSLSGMQQPPTFPNVVPLRFVPLQVVPLFPYDNNIEQQPIPVFVQQKQGEALRADVIMLPCKQAALTCKKCGRSIIIGSLLGCSAGASQVLLSSKKTIEACGMCLCAPCAQSLIYCDDHNEYCPFYTYLQCTKDCFPDALEEYYTPVCHKNDKSTLPWFLCLTGCCVGCIK